MKPPGLLLCKVNTEMKPKTEKIKAFAAKKSVSQDFIRETRSSASYSAEDWSSFRQVKAIESKSMHWYMQKDEIPS